MRALIGRKINSVRCGLTACQLVTVDVQGSNGLLTVVVEGQLVRGVHGVTRRIHIIHHVIAHFRSVK